VVTIWCSGRLKGRCRPSQGSSGAADVRSSHPTLLSRNRCSADPLRRRVSFSATLIMDPNPSQYSESEIHHMAPAFPSPFIQASSSPKPKRQHQQTRIRSDRQRSQHHHHIPTCAKPLPMQPILAHLRKELLVALLSSQQTDQQDTGAVDRE